jgi:hypothetical protein
MIHVETELFYGFPIEETLSYCIDGYHTLKEYIHRKYGIPEPVYHTAQWNEWLDKSLDIAPPCDIGMYNHAYKPKYFVFVSASLQLQHHSDNEELKPINTMIVKLEWDDQLQDYCRVMGITYRQPNVYVVTYWS